MTFAVILNLFRSNEVSAFVTIFQSEGQGMFAKKHEINVDSQLLSDNQNLKILRIFDHSR